MLRRKVDTGGSGSAREETGPPSDIGTARGSALLTVRRLVPPQSVLACYRALAATFVVSAPSNVS
jgi:hypothetical protein